MRMQVLAGSVLLCSLFVAGRVDAGPAEDRAAADALFKEGRALIDQGKLGEACPKLAASQKLDPKAGRLLALGDCYERNGQTASAWATFHEAGTMARGAKDQPREQEAGRRAGLLEGQLAKLVIEVAPEGRVAGLEVKRNGRVIEEGALGVAVPVDPGEQVIEAAAPGKKGWREKIEVAGKGGVTVVRVPGLEEERVVTGKKEEAGEAERGKNLVVIGVGVGLAVVGIGVGVGLMVAVVGKSSAVSDARKELSPGACPGTIPTVRDKCSRLKGLLKDMDTFQNVGTGMLIAGGVIAAGTVAYALWPTKRPAPTVGWQVVPTVAPTFAGVSVSGQF